MNIGEAKRITGGLGFPSKMPGTSYGLPASACKIGMKLVNTPGSVCHGCYALKDHYAWTNPQKAQHRRLASIVDPAWTVAMITLLAHVHSKPHIRVDLGKRVPRTRWNESGWHRWHDSGDLQSVPHLTKICAVAAGTPQIRHWLPTRELAMVLAYTKAGGVIPGNLTIRVSATMVDGPATSAWPTTSTVHHAAPAVGRACPAPLQNNECGACRACWDRVVANVSYHKH